MPRTKKNKIIVEEVSTQLINKDKNINDNIIQNLNENKNENAETKIDTSNVQLTKNKRGRKPKKIITNENICNTSNNEDVNIGCEINEKIDNTINISESISFISQDENENDNDNLIINVANEENIITKTTGKKRGRKPKGGKIIQQLVPIINSKETKPNVILHLKCSLKDLSASNLLNNNIESYSFNSIQNELNYEVITTNNDFANNYVNNKINNLTNINYNYNEDSDDCENNNSNKDNNDMRDVWKKLKNLEHNLHINNISDKKSACFWCTCEFDNPPVYIPKYFMKDSYHVYGCFCSPECATAYLMEENIDSSAKFERYHLINHIYAKIYNYTKNIKPAPNPFYMLDKFYGNLTIQEYRSLLKNERLFLIVDKPLTRILPELHEDNDDFIMNNKIIPSNTYQIKKKLQKQTKSNILNEKFGLNTN